MTASDGETAGCAAVDGTRTKSVLCSGVRTPMARRQHKSNSTVHPVAWVSSSIASVLLFPILTSRQQVFGPGPPAEVLDGRH